MAARLRRRLLLAAIVAFLLGLAVASVLWAVVL
jgi:hypothetical protein